MSKESRHRNRVQQERRDRSDRYIRTYQKLCVYCLLPALLDLFSCVLALFSNLGIQVSFRFGVSRLLLDYFAGIGLPALILLPSGVLLCVFTGLALLAAKGKTPCAFTLAGLYAADCLFLPFYMILIHPVEKMGVEEVLSIIIHVVFLTLNIMMIVFYVKATKSLREEKRIK